MVIDTIDRPITFEDINIPPIDTIVINTGGSEFENWREKYKNNATYISNKERGLL